MTELMQTQCLFDANAIVTTLVADGMAGVVDLLESDPETFEDVAVLLSAVSLLKNTIDGLLPILAEAGTDLTWGQIICMNAERFVELS